jgi:hypothetical protein
MKAALACVSALVLSASIWVFSRNDQPPAIKPYSPASTTAPPADQGQDGTYVMPDESMPTASTIAPYKPSFELAAGAVLKQTDAPAYRWLTPDTNSVSELAEKLGITVATTEVPKADGGGWRAGGLLVLPNANWSFRADLLDEVCDDVNGCPIPERGGIPNDDRAKTLAVKFLRNAAADVKVLKTERDSMGVTVFLEAPAAESTYQTPFTVTIGHHGVITAATGRLGTPERTGTYATVSLQKAIDQLNKNPQLRRASKQALTCKDLSSVCMPDVLQLSQPSLTTKLLVAQDQSLWIVPAYAFVDQLGSIWVTEATAVER